MFFLCGKENVSSLIEKKEKEFGLMMKERVWNG